MCLCGKKHTSIITLKNIKLESLFKKREIHPSMCLCGDKIPKKTNTQEYRF